MAFIFCGCYEAPLGGTYSISGIISNSTTALANVQVTLQSEAVGTVISTSDVNGSFTFSDITNGTYTITPVKAGYIFVPSQVSVTVQGDSITVPSFSIITTWQRSYGGEYDDNAAAVVMSRDNNGYVIAGSTDSIGAGSSDGYVVKVGVSGSIIWEKTYGGTSYDVVTAIIPTLTDDGYLLVGSSESSSSGGSDIWIVKITADGTTEWEKRYGGSSDEYANAVIQSSDGNYVVVGSATSSVAGQLTDMYMIKINASTHEKIWDRYIGGTGWDSATTVCESTNTSGVADGYLFGGYQETTASHRLLDCIMVSTDGASILWEQTWDASATDEAIQAVAQLTDGSFGVAGYTSDSSGFPHIWAATLSHTGSVTGTTTALGGSGTSKAYTVVPRSDGGFLIAGYAVSTALWRGDNDLYIARVDAALGCLWTRMYDRGEGNNDCGYGISETPDNCLIVAGYAYSGVSHNDAWVLKLDPTGLMSTY